MGNGLYERQVMGAGGTCGRDRAVRLTWAKMRAAAVSFFNSASYCRTTAVTLPSGGVALAVGRWASLVLRSSHILPFRRLSQFDGSLVPSSATTISPLWAGPWVHHHQIVRQDA